MKAIDIQMNLKLLEVGKNFELPIGLRSHKSTFVLSLIFPILWGCSSVGRASALQAEGQRFDSAQLHHLI